MQKEKEKSDERTLLIPKNQKQPNAQLAAILIAAISPQASSSQTTTTISNPEIETGTESPNANYHNHSAPLLQTIIAQSIQDFAQEDKPFSLSYKIAQGLFVFIIAASTTPLNWTYSYEYASTVFIKQLPQRLTPAARMAIVLLVPIGDVLVYVGENIFVALATWDGLAKIFTNKESVWKKVLRAGGAVVLCVPPSSPTVAAAFLEKNVNVWWGWINKTGTLICTAPFNYYSALAMLEDTAPRLLRGIKGVFSSDQARWQSTLMLKSLYLGMIADQCNKLRNNSQLIRDFYSGSNLELAKALPQSSSVENTVANFNKPFSFSEKVATFFKELSAKQALQKIPEIVTQTAAMSLLVGSWGGFQCALAAFVQENIVEDENISWGAAIAAMLPLYYVSAKFSITGVNTLFRRFIFRQPDTELPYCLKHYPKTTIALGILVTALSVLTYVLSDELIRKNCPKVLQEVAQLVNKPGSPLFNATVCLNLIDSVIRRLTLRYHQDDKAAEKVIAVLESIVGKIAKMSPREFAEGVLPEKMRLFAAALAMGVQADPALERLNTLIETSEMELNLDNRYRDWENAKKKPEDIGGLPTIMAVA